MASVQQKSYSIVVLSDEKKAVLKDMMKELEKVNGGHQAKQLATDQAQTYGQIKNETVDGKQLGFNDSHDWSGTVAPDHPYPKTIDAGSVGYFVHDGPTPLGSGSKGAVVYSDPAERYWFVAFHTPDNKVYVEAGPSITTIDWSAVETKLDSSGSTSSFTDPKFGGQAYAQISGDKLVTIFSN